MFGKASRLHKGKELSDVYKRGYRTKAGPFFVFERVNGLGRPRVAVNVGKKFDRRAVVRNRQRRLFQAALASLLPDDHAWDLVISYNQSGKMLSYKDIYALLEDKIRSI